MTADDYDIQELVNQSGVPRRTIYFYVQQGILPPPQGAGLAAHYTEDHLLRLRLIPVLRGQGLRLDEIRERFAKMDSAEMRQVLASASAAQAASTAASLAQPSARSIREPAAGDFSIPGWSEQRFTHYPLPGGIQLIAPETLGPVERQKLNQLLQAARQIFLGSSFMILDTNPPSESAKNGGIQPPEKE